jgi:hypothetical protein
MKRSYGLLILIFALLAMNGCSQPARQEVRTGEPSFVNRVWTVAKSNTVSKGTLYVFLSEGTLVITSPQSKPLLGSWRREGKGLVMVEESIEYPVDILHLAEKEFRILSHNPGTPVEIKLVRADLTSLPGPLS